MLRSMKPARASSASNSVVGQRAGDAADPQLHIAAHRRRELAPHHDVGIGQPPAGLAAPERPRRSTRCLSAERLTTQLEMITSTEASGSGNVLDVALEELDVARRRPCAGCRAPAPASRRSCRGRRPCPSGADAPGRKQHVDPAARAEVEHRLPGCSSASAVGLPQPSEASTAASGRPAVCAPNRGRRDRIAVESQLPARRRRNNWGGAASPRPLPPAPYFSRTASPDVSAECVTGCPHSW